MRRPLGPAAAGGSCASGPLGTVCCTSSVRLRLSPLASTRRCSLTVPSGDRALRTCSPGSSRSGPASAPGSRAFPSQATTVPAGAPAAPAVTVSVISGTCGASAARWSAASFSARTLLLLLDLAERRVELDVLAVARVRRGQAAARRLAVRQREERARLGIQLVALIEGRASAVVCLLVHLVDGTIEEDLGLLDPLGVARRRDARREEDEREQAGRGEASTTAHETPLDATGNRASRQGRLRAYSCV